MINNIFTRLLKVLNIPYTEKYANELFYQQPYRNTMYGLMRLMDKYKIDNECVQFTDTSLIGDKVTPMIISLNGKFIIVKRISQSFVSIINIAGMETEIERNSFLSQWDGIAILIKPDRNSSEPNINTHIHIERQNILKKTAIVICICLLFLSGILTNPYRYNPFWYAIIAINALGVYTACLLLQKQLKIHNNMADKICSFIKESKCENVTESSGGSIFGLVKLSEVGFSFFIVNFLTIVFIPNEIYSCGIYSLAVLPFSFWSIWYQKYKVKSWCVLCLVSLLFMWLQAIMYFLGKFISIDYSWTGIFGIGTAYILSTLTLNKFMQVIKNTSELRYWRMEYENLKVQDEVINAYQQKMPLYDTSTANCSSLIFGDPSAKRSITIFSNPYCNPCAKMHKRIVDFPSKDVYVKYVMTSFSEELMIINKYIIAAYQQLGEKDTWKLLSDWYEFGRDKGIEFFAQYKLNINTPAVDTELQKQLNWRVDKPFYGTPTVLINGKELSGPYQVEDYIYL